MKKCFPGWLICAPVVLIVSCATPDARIKQSQELFDTWPPEVQERLREGKIEIGDTTDMVFIALGKPDREYTRRTAARLMTVWSYTDHYTQTRRQLVDGEFRVRDSRTGYIHEVRDAIWVDVPTYHEYDRLRVEFYDDLVVAIEGLDR
jgi:hypothetical protein